MLVVCVWLIFSISVLAQDNKAIEKKWGIGDDSEPVKIKETFKIPKNFSTVFPIHLEPHKPEVQSFPVNPSMENVIKGKFGTEVIIPPNSISLPSLYRKGDIITIELREILNDLDFLTLGVDMLYYDSKSKPHILESGGMLELKAIYFNRELNLKKGAKLKVKSPKLASQKMKVYFFQNGAWTEKGTEETLPPNTEESSYVFWFLDSFGLWNLDTPNPEITCIRGEIQPLQANPPYYVSVVGTNYKGAYTKNFNEVEFKINALQSKQVKLIVSDSKGNFGTLDLKTSNKPAFIDFTNYKTVVCDDVGKVEIKLTDSKIRSNRESLLKHLGLVDSFK